MPLAQLADPWQKMPVGTAGEEPHHEAEDSVGEDDSAPLQEIYNRRVICEAQQIT